MGNFSVASPALLNRETLEEVLPVVGVLVGSFLFSLFSRAMVRLAKKERPIKETHRKGGEEAAGTVE